MTKSEKAKAAKCKDLRAKLKEAQHAGNKAKKQLDIALRDQKKIQGNIDALGCDEPPPAA